jgi:hypothetical protein
MTVRDVTIFHNLVVGETTLEEEIKNDHVKIQASNEIIAILKARFVCMSPSPFFPSSSSALAGTNASSTAAYNAGGMREHRILSGGNNPSSANNPDDSPPLKAGWLLKKRDIISGWKRRYFEVYMDRLDYFASPDDIRPRGSYPLYGVEVNTVRPIRIKRKFEHYGLFLDLRCPEKTIKLATEKTGLEGKMEADAWYQIFVHVANNRSKSFTQNMTSPSVLNVSGKNSSKKSKSAAATPVGGSASALRSPMMNAALTPVRAGAANPGANSANGGATSPSRQGMGQNVVRFVRRLTSSRKKRTKQKASATASHSNYILQDDGTKVSSPWQMLLYGGGIIGLSASLGYSWWVQKSMSTKTFVTLSVLMLVLLAIFIQEFILDDDGDDEYHTQEAVEVETEADKAAKADSLDQVHESFDHGFPGTDDEDGGELTAPKHKEDLEDEDDDDYDENDDDDDDDSDEEAHAAAKARTSFKHLTPIIK